MATYEGTYDPSSNRVELREVGGDSSGLFSGTAIMIAIMAAAGFVTTSTFGGSPLCPAVMSIDPIYVPYEIMFGIAILVAFSASINSGDAVFEEREGMNTGYCYAYSILVVCVLVNTAASLMNLDLISQGQSSFWMAVLESIGFPLIAGVIAAVSSLAISTESTVRGLVAAAVLFAAVVAAYSVAPSFL
ncbi:MAG: hypothetical protein Q4Q62_02120 [Thermoplasmata archaeon]|nr:hypothetical protein [Thermoplasmata archaeon]